MNFIAFSRPKTAPGAAVPGAARRVAALSRRKLAMLASLALFAGGLGRAATNQGLDQCSAELSDSPVAVSLVDQERFRQIALQAQELYRPRVAIPDAAQAIAVPAGAQEGAASRMPTTARNHPSSLASDGCGHQVLLAGAFLLAAALVFRTVAPHLAAWANARFNPWVLAPAAAAGLSSKTRVEEVAFSEFQAAFRLEASPAPRTPPFACGSSLARMAGCFGEGSPRLDCAPAEASFGLAPEHLDPLRRLLQEIGRTNNEAARHEMLVNLHDQIRALRDQASRAELLPVRQLTSALEGFLEQLTGKPGNVTSARLRTLASGLDLLDELCSPGLETGLAASSPFRFLVVDDDRISRHALSFALNRALNQPDLAEDGERALPLASRQPYDVIFLDVQMPGMGGFELCPRIHNTVPNRVTPVVFVTCHSDLNSRAQSTLSGGDDFIPKPFLTSEIAVKALTFALRGRRQKLRAARP